MRIIIFLLSSLIITDVPCLNAQDIITHTFTYESTTRDTIVEFPDEDHNGYEKILLHYSMRCKDGLVSTGSNRNLGCGEWDYSCNTYIVDSTRVDSLIASAPDHLISGFSGDQFQYRHQPTYSFNSLTQYEVSYNNIIFHDEYPLGNSDPDLNASFGAPGGPYSIYYVLSADDLLDNGLEKEDLTGISFNIISGSANLENLKVEMAHTMDSVATRSGALTADWQETYFFNTYLDSLNTELRFYENFEWDGQSNVAVRISYREAIGSGLDIHASALEENSVIKDTRRDSYLEFGPAGSIYTNGDFEAISEEITIAFWQFGDDRMPLNSTVFEGRDANGLRQVNVHLPWGNGQVYWDCGNDGSGFNRINKTADPENFKGRWNHWTFTKNAMNGTMHIYLNGQLWHSGTGMYNAIDIDDMMIGSAIRSELYYYGSIDDFRIWSRELGETEVMEVMTEEIDDSPVFDQLLLAYSFNNIEGNIIPDESSHGMDGEIDGVVGYRVHAPGQILAGGERGHHVPFHNLHQGLYYVVSNEINILDSVENLPAKVEFFSVEGTDLVLDSTAYLYEAGTYAITDRSGMQIGERVFHADGIIEVDQLTYYSKQPMAFEIMSFVTPYGIGLDFGPEGHTWTFDVTEFGPILKGRKRMYLSRGGQWQEDMDIRFEFIKGIPDQDVLDINQIWPVTHSAYNAINSDSRFEPRHLAYDPSVSRYVVKAAITGHGQEGEFIPRNHSLDIGGFKETWQVWTECGDNPIYPQGGTWVYDRAGWCPGAPTDVRSSDITEYLQFLQDAELDYGIQSATGDSRYIVNFQLIEYGPPNKSLDASIHDIIHPGNRIEHSRYNPNCQAPVIVLKNNGAEALTHVVIEYGIEGQERSYEWTGFLNFQDTEVIELDFLPSLMTAGAGDIFIARVVEVNGRKDEYAANDELKTVFTPVEHYDEDILIEFRTNFQPLETSWSLLDENGSIVDARTIGSLTANTLYRDTITNLNGCYTLLVEDRDDDGLSWWANNDGNGYVRISSVGAPSKLIATDFGKFVAYNFTAGMVSSLPGKPISNVRVFPNPTNGPLYISGFEGINKDLSVAAFDVFGRELARTGIQSQEMNTRGLNLLVGFPPGIYFITLDDGEAVRTFRIIRSKT